MNYSLLDPESFAIFLTRFILGVLFFFQGYDKVIKLGVKGVVNVVGPSYKKLGFPDWAIYLTSFITSWIEFAGGGLLIIGLFRHTVIYLLGIDLMIVCIGMSMIDPVWDMKLVLPRLALLVAYLLMNFNSDVFCIDKLIN